MKLQFGPFLLITALLSAPAWPQSGPSLTPTTPVEVSQPQGDTGPQPVFTHPEEKPPLALLDEITAHSYVNVGLGVTTAWDSNAAAFSYHPYSQALFMFNPSLALRQTRPDFTWYVGVNGTLTTSTTPGYYNTSSPSANAGFTYDINKHWQIAGSDSYAYSYDPFQQYLVYSSTPTYNQPNPTVYVPLTTTESNYGNIDLTYQITAHDSLTFTGTESFRRFLHNTYSAWNLYTWGGVAVYQHVFSPKFSAGGAYNFTSLDFGHGQSRSGVQTFQAFASYRIAQHMTVTGWVGPELTNTKNLIPILCDPYGCFIEVRHNSQWDTAFGGSFGWQGQRNAASVGFYKSISDGGLLLGIVKMYQFNGNYIRQLSPRWSFALGALYGNNTGYSTRLHLQKLDSFVGNVGFTRQLTPSISANVQ
jgi:hypothetical protein